MVLQTPYSRLRGLVDLQSVTSWPSLCIARCATTTILPASLLIPTCNLDDAFTTALSDDCLQCECSRKRVVKASWRQNSKNETRLHVDNGNHFSSPVARLESRTSGPVILGGHRWVRHVDPEKYGRKLTSELCKQCIKPCSVVKEVMFVESLWLAPNQYRVCRCWSYALSLTALRCQGLSFCLVGALRATNEVSVGQKFA